MKKILLIFILTATSWLVSAQAPTYINSTTTFFSGSGLVWYGDVTFGPDAVVYIENGAAPIFFGKNMIIDPAAKFISLPGNNQTGTGKIIFRDNNPIYPSYPLQQTLNGGYTAGVNPSLLNIEIDNANGVSLSGNIRVTNKVQFVKGHIYLNNFDLVLDNDGTIENFDVTKHIVTNGTGVLTKEEMSNSSSFLFPISIAGLDYTPARVTNTAATRNINIQVKNYSSSASLETIFETKGMDRTWQITSNLTGEAIIALMHNTVANSNGASTDESAFINSLAYVSQQLSPGIWTQSCAGTNGGTPVSTNVGTNLIVPNSINATSFFTKQSVACVDLRIAKTVNNAVPFVGTNLVFTLTVSNLGVIDATGVLVNDLLPAGYTFVSAVPSIGTYVNGTGIWTIGNLTNGATATLAITARVNATGSYANTAKVTGNEEDPELANNTSTVTPAPGVVQANLAVVKTATNLTPLVGDQVVFTLSASNNGPNDASNVKVTDLLAAGYTFIGSTASKGTYNAITGSWMLGTLNNGEKATLTITVKVNAIGPYGNSASIVGAELDPELDNNTSTITPVPKVLQANLQIVKSVNNATPLIGSNVVFTISIRNQGPNNASNVSVTDMLAAGYTYVNSYATLGAYYNESGVWAVGDFANGATATLTITAKVNPIGPYLNKASIVGNEIDPDPSDNSSTVIPTPAAVISTNLAILKTVDNSAPLIGSNVVFTLTARNLGTSDAAGVNVSDLLPAGYTFVSSSPTVGTFNAATGNWSIGNLPNEASATLTITARVNATGPYANTATITGGENDPEPGNNTSTVTPTPAAQVANLAIVKTVDNMAPTVATNVTFTIKASNNGANHATGVTVTDVLPVGYTFISSTASAGTFNTTTGIWTIGNLANGTNETLIITAKVNATGPYANTATITGNEPDPVLTNNTSTVTPLPVTGMVNLSIQKTTVNALIAIGDSFDYTITVKNIGAQLATEVIATDVLPLGVSYISSTVTNGSISYYAPTRTLKWYIGNLQPGATLTLTLSVAADLAGTIVNTATVVAKETEITVADNISVAANEVIGLKIPNVITPDGDGKNDTFKIIGLNNYIESKLNIYSRWNNEVWHSTGSRYTNQWFGDGLNGGTYYYVLSLKDKAGKWQNYTGWILLIKN